MSSAVPGCPSLFDVREKPFLRDRSGRPVLPDYDSRAGTLSESSPDQSPCCSYYPPIYQREDPSARVGPDVDRSLWIASQTMYHRLPLDHLASMLEEGSLFWVSKIATLKGVDVQPVR